MGSNWEPVAPSHYCHRRNICRLHSHGPLSQTRRRVETNRMGNRAPQPNRAGNARGPRRRYPQGAEYTHRFGQYWQQIDRLRAQVQEIPTERGELSRLCWNLGLPGDFDVAQITWRPDYDLYYHEQLNNRARTMYVFRDEYIFDLEKSVVVEVPQAGHATYVFAKPADAKQWVWQYAKTTRQDIRVHRDNVAESLGFLGRVVHGKNKAEWLKELRTRIGESPHYAQTQ